MKPTVWKTFVGVVAIAALISVLYVSHFRHGKAPEQQAAELFRRASLLQARGNSTEAEKLARQAITLNVHLSAAHRLAAQCAVERNDYQQALEDLSSITEQGSDDWLAARKLAADILHYRVYRLRDAEHAYRDVLSVRPDDVFANDGYARLLGLCGRRSEAIPHVLRLLRAGEHTDLLMLLSRESGALSDPELLEAARRADPSDPNPLLGQASVAAADLEPDVALDKLKVASELNELPRNFHGQLGRLLLAAGRFGELDAWARDVSNENNSAETWLVLAELAERTNDRRGAIRCYWEAVKLRPESLQANNQLAQELTSDGHSKLAEPFLRQVQQINKLRDQQQLAIMSGEQPKFADVFRMIQAYESVGRLWEACGWGRLAAEIQPDNAELRELLQNVLAKRPELPLELTAREYNPAYQIDLSYFPLPTLAHSENKPASRSVSHDILFRRQRAEIGFDFQFFDGTNGTSHRMFEFSGGGIAVIDFDNDKAPDLLCTQGRLWNSATPTGVDHHDCLFRNHRGKSFDEIAQRASMAGETGFGQGASVGDVNNDGFADLYVANTAVNTLWVNNGDGTFTDHSASLSGQSADWTTSCLIADLNGDFVPDLYDVNYLAGDDVFDRTCHGEHGDTIMCAPYDFEPAMDRVWLGDGTGGFTDATTVFLNPAPVGKGLGIAALNTGDSRLSLFVANDTTANFFYTAESPSADELIDSAVAAGLAFNGSGKAEACMGVAVGDCTQDGRLDLLVTNFLYESNTLYSAVTDRFFEDRTRELGLQEETLPVLGFGTQFLDANLDGRFELFVANGHTQDLSMYGTPFRMQPHLFEWTGNTFQKLAAEEIGAWSEAEMAGRAVARLDWNLDGKPDLAVGILDEPSFMLTNASPVENQFLALTLVGTTSARDAVGTTVTAQIGGEQYLHQLTAGDGYQCSSERIVQIGCGSAAAIDQITVVWPSGRTQTFSNVPVSQTATLVEGRKLSRMRTTFSH